MQPAQQLDPGVRAQRLEEAAVHAGKINRPLARHTAIESEPAGECHPHIVRPIPRATPSIGGEVNGYVQRRLADLSANPVGSTPEALTNQVKSELAKWEPIINAAGLRQQ